MKESECLSKMVSPGMVRHGRWRGGIMQIHVTRACDLSCFHCTQGSNLGGKPVMITPEEFDCALASLEGYWGVVGIFGGNPALHPQFEELCTILCRHFPFSQRGVWCNHPRGHGRLMSEVFNPRVSNLNVHLVESAYEEFARDWPESRPYLKGHDTDSLHSAPYVAMIDQENISEDERWARISSCDVNQDWSAMLCSVPGKGLRAFFCEIAGAQAMLHCNDPSWPDLGIEPYVGWWRQPMGAFADQVRFYCHRCGIPLRRHGQLAVGGDHEEVSPTHAGVYKTKDKNRQLQIIEVNRGDEIGCVTDYIENGAAETGVDKRRR